MGRAQQKHVLPTYDVGNRVVEFTYATQKDSYNCPPSNSLGDWGRSTMKILDNTQFDLKFDLTFDFPSAKYLKYF